MSKFSKLVQKQKEAKEIKKTRFNLEAKVNANRKGGECSCNSKKSYISCCGTIHTDICNAKLPVDLMKSRYTAYVHANIEFLMLSHHSSTKPFNEKEEILEWTKSITWLGLEVVDTTDIMNNIGFVTFKAHFIENGLRNTIHEKSRFVKENGYWTYIDGQHI